MSLNPFALHGLQFLAFYVVLMVVTVAASTKVAPREVLRAFTLVEPVVAPYQPKVAPARSGGGGGGGDRSELPPSKGRLPKQSLRPYVPPAAVIHNLNPRLAMEPAIMVPPDVQLPNVDMAQYGDPLARLGPASNGPGSAPRAMPLSPFFGLAILVLVTRCSFLRKGLSPGARCLKMARAGLARVQSRAPPEEETKQ